ncbi:hypothetical protein EIP86_006274 [Pleurotus ostreatoroseus]|nr:hypothetical protein EIP86_006274 [Pleurotus ostreatoroseus]
MDTTQTNPSLPAGSSARASPLSNSKAPHQKRPTAFSKHPMHLSGSSFSTRTSVDSPAYDASEEDNDPMTDSGASVISVSSLSPPTGTRARNTSTSTTTPANSRTVPRHALATSDIDGEVDEGIDSPTYDGDVESSTTVGLDDHPRSLHSSSRGAHQHVHAAVRPLTASLPLSKSPPSLPRSTPSPPAPAMPRPTAAATKLSSPVKTVPSPTVSRPTPSPPMIIRPTPAHPSRPTEPTPAHISKAAFDPAKLTPEDIVAWFREMIDGPGLKVDGKLYKINEPPTHRPVRIYADGVYDLFHFGHALQLRQAKLAFPAVPPPEQSEDTVQEGDWTPGVYLLAGVNSDEQCEEHKNKTVMTHAERCEAVRHCRWVDEVVPDAPWVIDAEFLEKHKIDYVAHDADPYGSAGHDDVYSFIKKQGKFLPTRRTPGISTSDLLARLVSGYRHRIFDKKLAKMGMHQLMAEGSDWDESRSASRVASQVASRAESPVGDRENKSNAIQLISRFAGELVHVLYLLKKSCVA